MGQKVNPHGLRVGVIKDWDSKWYADADFSEYLVEDHEIRKFLKKKLYAAGAGIGGIITAPGTNYEILELPDTVTSLTFIAICFPSELSSTYASAKETTSILICPNSTLKNPPSQKSFPHEFCAIQ